MSKKNKLKADLILEVAQLQERVNELESATDETRWRSLAESSPDHILTLAPDLTIQYVNHPAPGLTIEDLVDNPITMFLEEEFQEETKTILMGVLNTEQSATYETEYHIPDGGMIYYETHAIPRKADGEVIGLTLSSRDITTRKQVEMELQKERLFTQNILNTARVIIVLLDVEGKIISINPYMEHISGYSLDEVIGKDWFTTYLPVRDRENIRKLFNTALKDSSTERNINPIVTKDGREILIEWHDSTFQDEVGNNIGLLAVGQDITERVQAEKEQQASEELLNDTQQLTKAGGWRWNVENKTMYWTDETYHIHEIDRTEIEPGSIKHLERGIKCYDEKIRPIMLEAIRKCVDEGIPYDLEFPFTTVKGNRIWIRTTARAEKENDKVVNVTGNIMDITERVQSEEALTRKNIVFDTSLAAQSILNLEGFLTKVNNSFLKIWDFSNQEEVIGRSLPEFLQHKHEAEAILAALQRTGSWAGEYIAKRGDGSTFIVRGLATVIRDYNDKAIGYQSSATDITKEKSAVEEIQSLAKFQTENPHPVLRIAQDGTLLYINPAGLEMFTVQNQTIPVILRECVSRSINTGKWEDLRLDYDDKYYSFFVAPVVQSGYANLYGRDITERKKAEREKDLLVEKLQVANKRLQSLSRELINSQEDERKRISQELHDELGQALTAISLDLGIIERDLDPEAHRDITNRLKETKTMAEELDERVSELALDLRPSLL
ncbi:MAG: PAS domain S-box protein, partial [Anaerolineales bacterium]|nr:PAS domain S-box protein [Anaerolineales bacterium]